VSPCTTTATVRRSVRPAKNDSGKKRGDSGDLELTAISTI